MRKPTYYEMKNGINLQSQPVYETKPNQDPVKKVKSKSATHARHKEQKQQVVDRIVQNANSNPNGKGLVICAGLRAKEEIVDLLQGLLNKDQMSCITFTTGLQVYELPEEEQFSWATIFSPDFMDLYYQAHIRLISGGNK